MEPRPEIVFALIGAVGTDLGAVSGMLSAELAGVGYRAVPIRLSRLMADSGYFPELENVDELKEDQRIDTSMDVGDAMRSGMQSGDAVVRMAIVQILNTRRADSENQAPLHNTAFIIHSLKHPGEVEFLREIYQSQVVIISVYSPKEQRIRVLNHRIAVTHDSLELENFRNKSLYLINKDEKEVSNKFGQNVRDTFPLADIFLDASDEKNLKKQITRTIEIVFGHPFRTPQSDEAGMFYAKAASLRSADLSRQVGSVIVNDDAEIIATGCNEVPFAGGGSLWEDKISGNIADNRDFKLGYDPSAKMKDELVREVFSKIPESWFSDAANDWDLEEKVNRALHASGAPLKGTRIASILEFGRIVHAEMSAITEAARRGVSVKGATLYCTTFPCHMCARHIIASGISRVVYIEPYPKSMTKDLYKENVNIDNENPYSPDTVHFSPFMGVSPSRFIDFFEKRPRKNDRGHVVEWKPESAWPRIIWGYSSSLETAAVTLLHEYLQTLEAPSKKTIQKPTSGEREEDQHDEQSNR